MIFVKKVRSNIERYKEEASNYSYLSTLKINLLKILITVQFVFNLFLLIYGLFIHMNIFGLTGQVLMLVAMGTTGYLIYRKTDLTKIIIGVTSFYAIVVIPGLWFGLGSHHALPVIMSLYTAILIILLLEGPVRLMMFGVYLIVATVMSVVDIYRISMDLGVYNAINRSISLYISFTMTALTIWIFKSMFMTISKELYKSSILDNLTGAYNTTMMNKSLEDWIVQYKTRGKNFAVGMIDMDNFKKVNDQYGHDAGDQALCAFVEHARTYVREGDLITRYGGDEFVFMFADCDGDKAKEILIRILDGTHVIKDTYDSANLSFSAGICDYREALARETDILKLADSRMYTAKHTGKDSIDACS